MGWFVGTSFEWLWAIHDFPGVGNITATLVLPFSTHTILTWVSLGRLLKRVPISISTQSQIYTWLHGWLLKWLFNSLLRHWVWTWLINVLSGIEFIKSLSFYTIEFIVKSHSSLFLSWKGLSKSATWRLFFISNLFIDEFIILILIPLIGKLILIIFDLRLIVSCCGLGIVNLSLIRNISINMLRHWFHISFISLVSIQIIWFSNSFIWYVSEWLANDFGFPSRDVTALVNWV